MTDTVRREAVMEAARKAQANIKASRLSARETGLMLGALDGLIAELLALPSADSALLAACRAALPVLREVMEDVLPESGEVERVHALVAAAIREGEKQ